MGRVKTLTADATANAKHEFHAVTQMALIQYQEGELDVEAAEGLITVNWAGNLETVTAGVVICVAPDGDLRLVAPSDADVGKLLRVAHRFCARWIRLDV